MSEGETGSSSELDRQTELSKAGYKYLKEGRFQEAEESFKGILEINPQNNYGLVGLGETAREYLAGLSRASQPIKKNVCRLLGLKDRWGLQPLLAALQKAMQHKAYGADYIENILHQMGNPTNAHPPVTLKDQNLNNIRLEEPNLADYDGLILKRRNDDD